MKIQYLRDKLKNITSQPLNQGRKLQAVAWYFYWRLRSRFKPDSLVYPWIGGAKFYFKRKEWGIVGNAFTGLLEFEEMSFLLHALRDKDLFIDVGANHGSFSILSSAVIGARTIAFEPIPETFDKLVDNVMLNKIGEKVICLNFAVGSKPGNVNFKLGEISSLSHIVLPFEEFTSTVDVKVTTLDKELIDEKPNILKIDVEGYEKPVLDGAMQILKNESLYAIIIELNEFGKKYGFDDYEIINLLKSNGLDPYSYNPFGRKLTRLEGKNPVSRNTIFIRNFELIQNRIQHAPKFDVFGKRI